MRYGCWMMMSSLAFGSAPVDELPAPRQGISDALFNARGSGFASLATLPSNVKGIEAGLLFANGMLGFVAIAGPSGWGKTHILQCVVSTITQVSGRVVSVQSTLPCLDDPRQADTASPLILDDAQEALTTPKRKHNLRMLLEHRLRTGRPTMLSFEQPRSFRSLRATLPHPREWTFGEILRPSAEERALVVRQIAQRRGIKVDARLIRLMANKMDGNGRTIDGALHKLSIEQPHWIFDSDLIRATGMLFEELGTADGWDLRDHVLQTVAHGSARLPDGVSPRDLGIYLMLRHIGICESVVASYFRLTPGETYARCQSVVQTAGQQRLQDFVGSWEVEYMRSLETV